MSVAKVMDTIPTLQQFTTEHYQPALIERALSARTLQDYHNKLQHILHAFGDQPINTITVRAVADFLAPYPATQANRYRSLLVNLFKYAAAQGLIEKNPAAQTLNKKVVKKRHRLSWDDFQAIYQIAPSWLKNAMDLALLTTQRREDIVNLKFSDIKDGYLFVIQNKTKKHGQAAYLKIKMGPSLCQVIERCRDDTVSPFLIHRIPGRRVPLKKNQYHRTYVTPDYLSKSFQKCRDTTTRFAHCKPEERPTFHEIRSLAIKLYEECGHDAQKLAGHTHRAMTEHYKKGHDIEWTPTEANLALTHIF